jgi:hypothetical protein
MSFFGLFKSKEEKIEILKSDIVALRGKKEEIEGAMKTRKAELSKMNKGPTSKLPEGFEKDIKGYEAEIGKIEEEIRKKEEKLNSK